MIEFRLLGPVTAYLDGRQLELARPQLRTVLAVLATEAGRPVSAETLIDRVWGDGPPTGARGVLYSHIARIRKVLEAADRPAPVVRHAAGYLLDVDPDVVDLHRFRRLAAAAGDPNRTDHERVEQLDTALKLWRGTPMADVPGEWAARSRTGWQQQRLDAAVAWAQAHLRMGAGNGGNSRVIGGIRDLFAEFPLAEPLAATMMRALAADGRDAEALECYATTRRRLADELGVEPGIELRDLHQAILRGDSKAGPAARPAFPRPAQLPSETRGFSGREPAIAALDALLGPQERQPSTVVISAVSGTAGIGKTALAVHWAHRVAPRFPDGQLYVNMRGFDSTDTAMDPGDALNRFLGALGVPAEQIPPDADDRAALYRSVLAGKRVLIVVDNARDTAQVRPLLPGNATAFVLVTSRNQLTPLVAAEGAHPLNLDVMSADEARALLENRLGRHQVAAEPEAVDRIVDGCARLPLALAIAAARAQQSGFSLTAVASELADSVRRLEVLDAGDPASRVRAVFSWSYDALAPPAARLFRLLGLHPGPDISAEAAAGLAGLPPVTTRQQLAELTQANLVAERTPGRYAFHDLLAAYAAGLGRRTDAEPDRRIAAERLLDHYIDRAHTAERLINPARDPMPLPRDAPAHGAEDRDPLEWLAAEFPAMAGLQRVAVEAGLDQAAWQLAWCLDTFLHRRGYWDDRVTMWEVAVAAADRLGDPVAAAHAHCDLARALNRLNRHRDSGEHLEQALDLFTKVDDLVGQAHTHRALASLRERQDQPHQALHHDQQALALFRAAGHLQGQADALNSLGWDHCLLGDHAQALTYCEEALTLQRLTGDRWGEATTWDSLGYAHHHLGHHDEAIKSYEQALLFVRDIGDRYFEADTLTRLGDTAHAAGLTGRARVAWEQALAILVDLAHPDAADVQDKLANC